MAVSQLAGPKLSRVINGIILTHYFLEAFFFRYDEAAPSIAFGLITGMWGNLRALRFEFVVVIMLFGIMDILHSYESYKVYKAETETLTAPSPSNGHRKHH